MIARPTLDIDEDKAKFVRDVERALGDFLHEKKSLVAELSPDSVELVDAIQDLSFRGGKRFRPLIALAGFRAACTEKPNPALATLGASLEMLQSYLLIHDDWMDQDSVRRGGPAIHAFFAEKYGAQHLGACLGTLSGDMACTWAWELFQQVAFPETKLKRAQAQFARMQTEVYCGQHLDVTNHADVSRMHLLKTASYSTVSPVLLGALLGDADEKTLETLQIWALAVGEAFQLRDDLISTFGNIDLTGKPSNELGRNKRNSVIATFLKIASPNTKHIFEKIVKGDESESHKREHLLAMLRDAKVTDEIERQIAGCTERALQAAAGSTLRDGGRVLLTQLTEAIANRKY